MRKLLLAPALVALFLAVPVSAGASSQRPNVKPLAAPTSGTVICGTNGLRGPTSAGSFTMIAAGDNVSTIQGIEDSNDGVFPADAGYWFAPGVHYLADDSGAVQIVPSPGDVFEGGYSSSLGEAVLEGTASDDLNYSTAAFVAPEPVGLTATGSVTVDYFTIEGFEPPSQGGAVNDNAGTSWVVENDTIQDNAPGSGLMIGTEDQVEGNCLTDNGQYGASAYVACPDGPGTSGCQGSTVTGGPEDFNLEDNEISYNDTCNYEGVSNFAGPTPPSDCSSVTPNPGCGCSGGAKFWETENVTVLGNYIHDNYYQGIWFDTDNAGAEIHGNYISGNYGEGIFYEIGYNAKITDNTLYMNGIGEGECPLTEGNTCTESGFPVGAMYISNSGGDSNVDTNYSGSFTIKSNVVEDNWDGVVLWDAADRFCGPLSSANGAVSFSPVTFTHDSPDIGDPADYPSWITSATDYAVNDAAGDFPSGTTEVDFPSDNEMDISTYWSGSYTTDGTILMSSPTCTLDDPSVVNASTCTAINIVTSPYYNYCRWETQNVTVEDNDFYLQASAIGSDCTNSNGCGQNTLFSDYGSTAPYTAYAIPEQLVSSQNDTFEDNTYAGPWHFLEFSQSDSSINVTTWTDGYTDTDPLGGYAVPAQDAGSTFCNSCGPPGW
jgi:hypothetical protein